MNATSDKTAGADITEYLRAATLYKMDPRVMEMHCGNALAEIKRLRIEVAAWKAQAEFEYGQYRLLRYGDNDYSVKGALDVIVANAIAERTRT